MKTLETVKTELLENFASLLKYYINPSKVADYFRTDIDRANIYGQLEGLQTALLALGVNQSKINNMIDAAHAEKTK